MEHWQQFHWNKRLYILVILAKKQNGTVTNFTEAKHMYTYKNDADVVVDPVTTADISQLCWGMQTHSSPLFKENTIRICPADTHSSPQTFYQEYLARRLLLCTHKNEFYDYW